MAKTYLEVQRQIEQLQREAEQLRKNEADGVLERIKEAIAVYGFTAADLGLGKVARGSAAGKPARAKKVTRAKKTNLASVVREYQDDQGNKWAGRGPRPAWFKAALEAGKTKEDLLVK